MPRGEMSHPETQQHIAVALRVHTISLCARARGQGAGRGGPARAFRDERVVVEGGRHSRVDPLAERPHLLVGKEAAQDRPCGGGGGAG